MGRQPKVYNPTSPRHPPCDQSKTMSSARLLRTVQCARPAITKPFVARSFSTTPRNMVVHNVRTVEEFKEAINKDKVIVDCFATWCGPCKAIAPILVQYSNEDPDLKDEQVHFVKFDVDELPELSQDLGVRAMPTFMFFKNGDKVDEMVGANPQGLLAKLKELASS